MEGKSCANYLNPIYDLERLISRVVYQTANPRDLIAFRSSLEMLPAIKTLLQDFESPLLMELDEQLDDLKDIYELICASIEEEPPISIREGGMIKSGYNEQVDLYGMPKQREKTGWQKSKRKNGKRQVSKICGSNLTKYLVIIWK